jgi:hypothetical protein
MFSRDGHLCLLVQLSTLSYVHVNQNGLFPQIERLFYFNLYSRTRFILWGIIPMSPFFHQNRRLTAVLKKNRRFKQFTPFSSFLIEFSVKSVLSVPKTSIFNRKSRLYYATAYYVRFVRCCYKFWYWLFFWLINIFTMPSLINIQTRKPSDFSQCGWYQRLERTHNIRKRDSDWNLTFF